MSPADGLRAARPVGVHQGGFVRSTAASKPMPKFPRVFALTAGLAGLAGMVGCHKAASPGTITVNNSYRGTCSVGKGKAAVIRAALDQAPAVIVADGASFEFANLSVGTHDLVIISTGARLEQGVHPWACQILVASGGAYTVRITCADNGMVSPSCP